MYYSTSYQSPLGPLTLASNEKSIVGLWMDGQKYLLGTMKEPLSVRDDLPIFAEAKTWLDCYCAGGQPAIQELSLAPIGGEFRQNVWKLLCQIPYGQVITYGDIARKMAVLLGREHMSAQAVGGAVSHNPISIIIPCHRVVGGNGSLTGYAGGVDKKIKLLKLEGVDISKYSVPTKGTAL